MTPAELGQLLLAAEDVTVQPVATPEWPAVDGQIYVRRLSALRREQYFDQIRARSGSGAARRQATGALLAAATLCDHTGQLLYAPDDQAAIDALGAKSYAALERVQDAAADLNGFSDGARVAAINDS